MRVPIVGEQLAPLVESPLPEVNSIADLNSRLEQVIDSNIPAFLVRFGAITETLIQINSDLRDLISAQLSQNGRPFRNGGFLHDLPGVLGAQNVGIGELHQDTQDVALDGVKTLDIHSTTSGAGSVLMANSGPIYSVKQAERPRIVSKDVKQSLQKLVLEGTTDPRFMSPEVYRADISTGDHVVFALCNQEGPVWHRFDTTVARRSASVSELLRV